MNAQIKLLIELQKLDKLIIEKNSVITELPRKIKEMEQPLAQAQAALEAKRREHEANLKQKKAKDIELDDMGQKINKLKTRTSEIKTNKEYQAHLKEIENAEKDRYRYEDEILALMEQIESSEKAIREEQNRVKQEEERLADLKAETEKQEAAAEKELDALRATRSGMSAGIEPDIYELYMNLIGKHRGSAVAEAKGEICGGCNMHIMPQLFVEIRKNEEINQCPQCDRILFYREEPVEEPANEPAK